MSSVNRPFPDTNTGSSLRGTGCPIAYRSRSSSIGSTRSSMLPPFISDPAALMAENEQALSVVVQDLVGIGLGQAQALDIGKGLLVGFVILQYRVVAAGHE